MTAASSPPVLDDRIRAWSLSSLSLSSAEAMNWTL
jgi:hypothetical protein